MSALSSDPGQESGLHRQVLVRALLGDDLANSTQPGCRQQFVGNKPRTQHDGKVWTNGVSASRQIESRHLGHVVIGDEEIKVDGPAAYLGNRVGGAIDGSDFEPMVFEQPLHHQQSHFIIVHAKDMPTLTVHLGWQNGRLENTNLNSVAARAIGVPASAV